MSAGQNSSVGPLAASERTWLLIRSVRAVGPSRVPLIALDGLP
jgi:hypothetical protein